MSRVRTFRRTVALLAAAALMSAFGSGIAEKDPLAAEIERWSAFVRDNRSTDETWAQIKKVTDPALAEARAALRDGRRLLALQCLASARMYASGFAWVESVPPGKRKTIRDLEAERARSSRLGKADPGKTSADAFADVHPAAVRAMGEATLPQTKEYYDASLEYARSTSPEFGFLYLAAARAQREFANLCRRLSSPTSLSPPPLRSLDVELDALEGELLAAYRPPAAIDRHSDFIAASASLKEARELDAQGLRYGALLRYLQAVQKTAVLRPKPAPLGAAALAAGLRDFDRRLSAGGIDHTIGRLFLESAQAESGAAGAPSPVAGAIVSDVLPRYFAALSPRAAEPPKREPRVTVTLVRWPYT